MKKADIKVGGYYLARVSGKLVTVRVDAIRLKVAASAVGDHRDRFDVTNLATGRKTVFSSAAKFRSEVGQGIKTEVLNKTMVVKERDSLSLVQVRLYNKLYTYDAGDLDLKVGDQVEVLMRFHQTAIGPVEKIGSDYKGEVRKVIRKVEKPIKPYVLKEAGVEIGRFELIADAKREVQSTWGEGQPLEWKREDEDGRRLRCEQFTIELEDEKSPDPTPVQTSIKTTTGARGVESLTSSADAQTPSSDVATASSRATDPHPRGIVCDACPSYLDPRNDPPEAEGLRGDQLKSFREVTGYLSNGHAKMVKLCGFAGTGKTFLLARIARWAKAKGWEVTVAAPTHKAAGVIKSKIGEGIEVRTIHSLLGLRLEPDYNNDTGGRICKAADSKTKIKQGLVICDEASMVGKTLKEHIDATANVKWLFVGDLAQLPPVGESISELLDDPDSTLEEVLRQAKGSEILNLATRIRQGDLSMKFHEGLDVFRLDNAEQLFQAALHHFASDDFKRDAAHARMLVFRNDRRKAINQRMRGLLIGSPEPFVPGEWLVMYAAFSPEKSRLNVLSEEAKGHEQGSSGYRAGWKRFFDYKRTLGKEVTQLHVSEEVLVQAVAEGSVHVGEWDFAVRRLTVLTKAGQAFELPVLREEEAERHATLMAELTKVAAEERKLRDECQEGTQGWHDHDQQRKEAWGLYFTLEETFAQVDYCYAMTVHKSQGSTFEHAFVDVPDLMSSGGMQQRILYTSATRPSKSLTFYT